MSVRPRVVTRETETQGTPTAAMRELIVRAEALARRGLLAAAHRGRTAARRADATLADSTGRSLETWAADLHGYVKTRPLQLLAVAIGIGYVAGKLRRL